MALGLVLPNNAMAKNKKKKRKLVILHTNDFHSRIEPFADNHPKYPGQGGIAALKAQIDAVMTTEKNVLLLDCGDIIQGTPYFNLFGGVVEIEWMNKIGYTASTLGNHDFDGGMENLAKLIKQAKFPFINCNYEVKNTALENLIKPYLIIKKHGLKIGITGVGINPEGLIPGHLCKGVVYSDPVEALQKVSKELKKKQHCDLVICLSHLGYQYTNTLQVSDKILASKSQYTDIILGGHTHTFLDKPDNIVSEFGKNVSVHQAGWAGLRLGKIEVEY